MYSKAPDSSSGGTGTTHSDLWDHTLEQLGEQARASQPPVTSSTAKVLNSLADKPSRPRVRTSPTLRRNRKVSQKSWPAFYQNLAVMFDSGLHITKALQVLSENNPDKNLGRVCESIYEDLQAGQKFSFAMSKRSDLFPWFYQNLVSIGEESGKLSEILSKIADYEERKQTLNHRIAAMLTYPCCLVMMMGLIFWVAPHFFEGLYKDILASANQAVPWYAEIVFALSNLPFSWPFWTVVIPLAGAGAYYKMGRAKETSIERVMWELAYEIPGVSQVLSRIASERFARSLALQLHAGADLLKSIEMAFAVTGSPVFLAQKRHVLEALKSGEELTVVLKESGLFESSFIGLVREGEESGRLPARLEYIANFYEANFALELELALSLAEPLLIGFTGIVAGVFCLALIVPLSQAIQAIA